MDCRGSTAGTGQSTVAMLLSRSIVHRLPTSAEAALLPDKLRSVVGGGVEAGIQRLLEQIRHLTAPGVAIYKTLG